MTEVELLESMRVLRKRGFLAFFEEPLEGASDTLFFGEIPQDLQQARIAASRNGNYPPGTWFLVTEDFHGREWVEDMLFYAGCFVLEVDNAEAIRQELLQIRPLTQADSV